MPAECASFWHSLNENSLQAFSAVAAEALGADFQVIATSGGGNLQAHLKLPCSCFAQQYCPCSSRSCKLFWGERKHGV